MPTDIASRTTEVPAGLARVLSQLRDVESQTRWVPQIREAELLESNPDGTPLTARFRASTPVGSDAYTLTYRHRPDGMDWSLVEGRLQSAQDGRYDLRELSPRRTAVTFELRITHGLPLPGFIRRSVLDGLVRDTLTGLRDDLSKPASKAKSSGAHKH
jgi:hypothetical protein